MVEREQAVFDLAKTTSNELLRHNIPADVELVIRRQRRSDKTRQLPRPQAGWVLTAAEIGFHENYRAYNGVALNNFGTLFSFHTTTPEDTSKLLRVRPIEDARQLAVLETIEAVDQEVVAVRRLLPGDEAPFPIYGRTVLSALRQLAERATGENHAINS